ncbi:anthranilate phosphoribosyltransferase [Phlyctochytrium planicorne]|nr:anthranilate phosphoribosyltransferase [Phlyctochytrium planicorne]
MGDVKEGIKKLLNSPESITIDDVTGILRLIMQGHATPAQIAAFLTGLKFTKKENDPKVVAAVASVMRSFSLEFPIASDSPLRTSEVVDIVGTGGDGQDTFNVSTASSIIAAGCGLYVAKHGNRASSSSCGSADVLEALGCDFSAPRVENMVKVLERSRFCFLFSQVFHPAMKHVAAPRKELGVRTIFNLLGPLINPANPTRAVVGVFSKELGPLMAEALLLLGTKRSWVVNGDIGLDEISPEGKTTVWAIQDGKIEEFQISPADFGLQEHAIQSVAGGDAKHNAEIMMKLLSNELDGPVLDFVLMNCASLLHVAGKASTLKEGVELARKSIASGAAKDTFLFFRDCR